MKFVYLVLLFVCCDGLKFIFKYPSPLRAIIHSKGDKSRLEITWEPVDDWDKNDPIIGYKVFVWEIERPTITVESLVDGELIEVEEEGPPSSAVMAEPTIYTVPRNNRNVTVEDMKAGIWYEYSALAYTKKGEGPRSPIVGVKRGGEKQKNKTPE